MRSIIESLTKLFEALAKLSWIAQVAVIVGLVAVVCVILSNPLTTASVIGYFTARDVHQGRRK